MIFCQPGRRAACSKRECNKGTLENRTKLFDNREGKGSEFLPGLQADLCKQLGIRKEDL